jgi:hypothetical protein
MNVRLALPIRDEAVTGRGDHDLPFCGDYGSEVAHDHSAFIVSIAFVPVDGRSVMQVLTQHS